MTDIPEDIKETARKLASWHDSQFLYGLIVTALWTERDRSAAAERERCAQIATDEDGHFSHWGEDRNTKVAQQTCADIAAAIRNPTP